LLYAQHIVGAGEQLLQAMCDAGQEGVIAKKAEAPYRSTRSKCWLKIKCTRRQEFVVIGWIDSTSATRGLRSLILAVTEGGELRFAGKVGTGFSMDVERTLLAKLKRLERKSAPADVPRAEARGARWVRPELVAEVAFAEFTSEGVVRHASFLGLRGDKQADEVVLEEPEHAAEAPTRSSRESGKNAAGTTHSINVSNPERVIYPDANITKGELFAYHEAVGALMLEWAANRPLSLVRCPQGRGKKCFFQKHNTGSFGPSVHQIEIREGKGTVEDYVYVQDVAGLLSCVQMGTIEFHGWGSATQDVEKPDRLIFDLDPDEGLGFAEVRRAATDLRRILADMGLQTFPMLTGGKGVHVVVPLTPRAEWPEVKDFAQRFAVALATAEPEPVHRQPRQGKAQGPHLYRLSPQSARRDGYPALQRPRPRRRAGGGAINWDELDDMEGGNPFHRRDADLLLKAPPPAHAGLGRGQSTPAGDLTRMTDINSATQRGTGRGVAAPGFTATRSSRPRRARRLHKLASAGGSPRDGGQGRRGRTGRLGVTSARQCDYSGSTTTRRSGRSAAKRAAGARRARSAWARCPAAPCHCREHRDDQIAALHRIDDDRATCSAISPRIG
jgi:bifunctional non-homologous end joining protein LigD